MNPEEEKSFQEVRLRLAMLGFSEFLTIYKSDVTLEIGSCH